jgi:hypothetical protein
MKNPSVMEEKISWPWTQEPATRAYPKPVLSSQHIHTLFHCIYFNSLLFSQIPVNLFIMASRTKFYMYFTSLLRAVYPATAFILIEWH